MEMCFCAALDFLYMFEKIIKIISFPSKITLPYIFLYFIILFCLSTVTSLIKYEDSIVFVFYLGCVFLVCVYVFIYFTIKFLKEKNSRLENKFFVFLIGEIIKKRKSKKYINWNAVSFFIACISIFVVSVTGFLSIKLSSQSLEISRDMKLLNERSLYTQKLVIHSKVLMDGNTILNSSSVVDGNLILSNFHEWFYRIMRLSDSELLKISQIMFLESEEENDYFRIKYGIEDKNLIYVIKFYLSKYRDIALKNNYYSTYVISEYQLCKMSLYEKRLLLLDISQDEVEMYIMSFFDVFVFNCMCKIYIDWIDPDSIKKGFPDFFNNYYGKCSVYNRKYILDKINVLSELNNCEYILFKNVDDYLLNNGKYAKEEMTE